MTEDESRDTPKTANQDSPDGTDYLPALDFSSIVLPLYAQALLKLGVLGDPGESKPAVSLELARRLIDLLSLLKDKTKGNLTPDEERFLDSCLQQIRMAYLQKSKAIVT